MIVLCFCIGWVIIAISTSWIWLPLLFATSPIWGTFLFLTFIILKLFGVSFSAEFSRLYNYLFYTSNKPKKFLWRSFYQFLSWWFPQPEWKCMNYGYSANSESGHTIKLDPEEEAERFCYELYHYTATAMRQFSTLGGFKVLEVGSGRGGGLAYISKNLSPKSCIGIDYSHTEVDFCRENLANDSLEFRWGDAEALPIEDEEVDMVINVESSHTYGNFKEFISEVKRVLKPGGHFVITDFREADEIEGFEADICHGGLIVERKEDISRHVLLSLEKDTARRIELIESRAPRIIRGLLKKFSGSEGSEFYRGLDCGETLYMVYHVVKRQS